MLWLCLALIPAACFTSTLLTLIVRALSHRRSAFDTAPLPGQTKAPTRRVPNTGGIAIFLTLATPLALAALLLQTPLKHQLTAIPVLADHIPGLASQAPAAAFFVLCLTLIFGLGIADDRRPLGPTFKLLIMTAASLSLVLLTDSRLLHHLDPLAGGPWLSILITTLWLIIVMNAMNFMDNADGLCAGVTATASAFFLAAALINHQWFVAAALALLLGATLGFLIFNFPLFKPASIFMGDAGSLTLGFTLAFLTIRTTYTGSTPAGDPSPLGSAHYGFFMPLLILAVPLYDFTTVTILRLSQGNSPFVGDLQHLSHRLMNRGLSTRAAVTIICALTAVTSTSGIFLASLKPWQAILVAAQTLLILLVLLMLEFASAPSRAAARS